MSKKYPLLRKFAALFCAVLLLVSALPISVSAATTIGTAKVTASVLNVRKGPSTKYGVVAKVTRNTTVTLPKKVFNNWYQVKLRNGKTGYCSGSYLKVSLKRGTTSSSSSSSSSNLSASSSSTASGAVISVPKGASILVLKKTTAN